MSGERLARSVVIVGGLRSPIGSLNGALSSLKVTMLAAEVARPLIEQTLGPKKDAIDGVIVGNVLPAGVGQAPAKQVAVYSGLKKETDCLTINKMCGSGLKAIALAYDQIRLGDAHCMLAGGMESMSQAPYLLMNARAGYRMGHQTALDSMIHDGLWDVYRDLHMGMCGELCAAERGFSRADQDRYAIESYKRAQSAQKNGTFAKEIAPIKVPQRKGEPVTVSIDEEPSVVNFDRIPTLPTVFEKDGTITAANASTINDGAAFVLLADEAWAKKQGLKPLARILGYAEASHEPEWFTTAPITAIQNVTRKLSLEPNRCDLYEINEAFSVVPLAAMKALNLSHDQVNVHGGAVSLGHPIGASGARVMVTLLNALQAHQKKVGLATLCIGGGEAAAMIVERL